MWVDSQVSMQGGQLTGRWVNIIQFHVEVLFVVSTKCHTNVANGDVVSTQTAQWSHRSVGKTASLSDVKNPLTLDQSMFIDHQKFLAISGWTIQLWEMGNNREPTSLTQSEPTPSNMIRRPFFSQSDTCPLVLVTPDPALCALLSVWKSNSMIRHHSFSIHLTPIKSQHLAIYYLPVL